VLTNAVNLPTSDTTGTLVTSATISSADQYIEALSGGITVNPGDEVLFTVSRTSSDSYAGDLQVLDQVGVLG
jgi:hypothetical protein